MSINRITPPAVKFELHAYGDVYDFSLKSISNWKDLEFTLKRDETSGIFHQISFPFEFVLDAYDVVKRIFDTYKYRAVGDMYIYLLKDNWPYVAKEEQYFEPQIFNLDWTTYDKSDNKIEIDTKRTSLYDFIKAKNKIVYDIPVSEIKEDKQWNFERVQLENKIIFRCTTNGNYSEVLIGPKILDKTIGVSYEQTEIAVPDIVYTKTIAVGEELTQDPEEAVPELMFMQLEGSGRFFEFDIHITGEIKNLTWMKRVTLNLIHEFNDPSRYMGSYEVDLETGIIDWHQKVGFLISGIGEGCYLTMRFEAADDAETFPTITINIDGTMNMSYNGKHKPEKIDIIDPKILLQSIVDKMTDSKGRYQSDIEDFNTDRNNLIMMSAAESIRGIRTTENKEVEVHTSYRSFVEWMNTYGYEQHIAGDNLTFRRRYKSFREDLTAIELEENECADLREYVNSDYIYTGVKIGYNKKDIENVNGRFEFNGVHDYSTDLNLGENILELISPYRADCYGIEFLTQERGKDTTDDKSDKDLFLINVSEESGYYTVVKNEFSGNCPMDLKNNKYENSIFNGNLNPFNLLKLNESLLGVSVHNIEFASSDSNSRIIIDGQEINAGHNIPKGTGLFDAHMYDIASKNIQHLPSGENVNGIVRFKYKGQTYEGFIEEVSKNPAWEMETVWILYKKKKANASKR